jgi:hypothetical protein
MRCARTHVRACVSAVEAAHRVPGCTHSTRSSASVTHSSSPSSYTTARGRRGNKTCEARNAQNMGVHARARARARAAPWCCPDSALNASMAPSKNSFSSGHHTRTRRPTSAAPPPASAALAGRADAAAAAAAAEGCCCWRCCAAAAEAGPGGEGVQSSEAAARAEGVALARAEGATGVGREEGRGGGAACGAPAAPSARRRRGGGAECVSDDDGAGR